MYRVLPHKTFPQILAGDCAMRLLLLACTFSLSDPALSRTLAKTALSEAHTAQRPDIAYQVNELLGAM